MQAKIVLCGEGFVGKSTIRERYLGISFRPNYLQTIGADYATKNQVYTNDGQSLRLQIWDLAGQQKFSNIREAFYKGTDGVILVFDVSNPSTADKLVDWINEIRKSVQEPVPIILVGNKIDLRSDIECLSTEKGKELAQLLSQTFNNPFQFIESSAKTGENIENIFESVAKEVIRFNSNDSINENIIQSFENYFKDVKNIIQLYLFKMMPEGPNCVSQTDYPKDDILLLKMAIFYSTTLGMGTDSHTGLFGPLPIPESKDTKYNNLQSLIFSFKMADKKHHDPRAKGINFCFIVITIAEDFIYQFNNHNALIRFFSSQLDQVKDIDEITTEYLHKLKKDMLQDIFIVNNSN